MKGGLSLSTQCGEDVLRIILESDQQRLGRAGRFASALLPVAQGADVYVDLPGELRLAQAGGLADLLDLQGIEVEFARGLAFTPDDLVHFGGALQELVEELGHDAYLQCSMRPLRALRWSSVRSSCWFFG